jgi:hypothetical protein
LNADGITAKLVCHAERSDVHPALFENLVVGEILGGIGARMKLHALAV